MGRPEFATGEPHGLAEVLASLDRLRKEAHEFALRIEPTTFFAPCSPQWSPAENFRHLTKCNAPVATALALPGWVLRLVAGKGPGRSRTFAEVRDAYRRVLAEGAGAGSYAPRPESVPEDAMAARQKLLVKWHQILERLARRTRRWSEAAADTHRLPHPLLGKLTLREMLFFTLYHQAHHLRNLAERYGY